MITICISGTPGTGKTSLAKLLSRELGFPILDVKRFIKEKDLSAGYDKKRRCDIVDIKILTKELVQEIKKTKKVHDPKGIIIDSHLSHYLPKRLVTLCIITRCSLKELELRLKKRKYSKEKIRENLDSEIFDTCQIEARELGHVVYVIMTTKGIKKQDLSRLEGEIYESSATAK